MIREGIAASAIEGSFRSLVKKTGYAKLTVSRLCEEANVSRYAFYNHYSNKRDVLSSIFYKDALKKSEQIYHILPFDQFSEKPVILTKLIYDSIRDNRELYQRILREGNENELVLAMEQGLTDLHATLTKDVNRQPNDACRKLRYARVFSSGAQSALIVQWLKDDADVSSQELAEWTSEWVMPCGSMGLKTD